MLANPSLEYFRILKKALPEEQAERIAEAIFESQQQAFKEIKELRHEIKAELKEDMNLHEFATRGDVVNVKKDLEILKLELQKDIELLRQETKVEIAHAKNQLLIWIFAMLVFFGSALMTVMAKGFHWI